MERLLKELPSLVLLGLKILIVLFGMGSVTATFVYQNF